MRIDGCVALVTGGNRGLGRAYVQALLAAGAAKIYVAARNLAAFADARLHSVRLDVTSPTERAAAVEQCADVTLLINNAGIMLACPMLAERSEEALRREMEVNVFGVLAMIGAFAPILAHNGGGAIVNMLSVVSWFVNPFNATYCASKHAALAVTDAARIQLKKQGTHVLGVYAGFIDTDMAARVNAPKTPPQHVAGSTLAGLRSGENHVVVGQEARAMRAALNVDPASIEMKMQKAWQSSASPFG